MPVRLRHEFRTQLQLTVICLLVIVFISTWVALGKKELMLSAVRDGLERVYDEVVADASRSSLEQRPLFTYESLRHAFLDSEHPIMTSFVKAEDIWVVRRPISIASKELVAIVRMPSGKLCGINGKRTVRVLSLSEILCTCSVE